MLRTTDPHSMHSCWAQGPMWIQASCKSGHTCPRAVVLFPLASHPSMRRLCEMQKGEFEPVLSQEWHYHPCQGHIWHFVRDLGKEHKDLYSLWDWKRPSVFSIVGSIVGWEKPQGFPFLCSSCSKVTWRFIFFPGWHCFPFEKSLFLFQI